MRHVIVDSQAMHMRRRAALVVGRPSMTAACDGSDTDIWFEGTPSYNKELAVSICRGCPMREACLLTHRTEPFGIFGGLTPSQRASFGKVRK
jgi:hypothetical protein